MLIQQLTEVWQDEEMKDILSRMSTLTLGLRQNISSLAQNSGQESPCTALTFKTKSLFSAAASLGSLRQECCYSNTVTGVGEYVELLKTKTILLHQKVLDTKKILIDHKIDGERHYPECKERLIDSLPL